MTRRWSALLLVAALAASGCGGAKKPAATRPRTHTISAVVASYDLTMGRPQRFLVGVLRADKQKLVSFGTAKLAFRRVGVKGGQPPRATASWIPIPGQQLGTIPTTPRFVDGSDGTGVYRARDVTFTAPGTWEVTATVVIAGRARSATSAFPVARDVAVPEPGDPAPATDNPMAGAEGVAPRSIDSRADGSAPFPDPELHRASIAAALARHQPIMVVVSTPTYCQSRFCGPITDSIQRLAQKYGDRTAFVHLEVWADYDKQQVSPYANEWIDPHATGDAREPWVFTVGADGRIQQRFDNVASDDELADATANLLGV
ncbi:MAG TPA: hypothetical protein VHD87_02695 [Acidimicrobiales bacterium]|nr:hypothetical protein [Acidimicrobiales bacterium]